MRAQIPFRVTLLVLLLASGVARAQAGAGTTCHLSYHQPGAPLLAHVKVVTVFFGSDYPFQDQLSQFYTAVTNSAYFDWLSEYNEPGFSIGRGSFVQKYVDTNPPQKTQMDNDRDIKPYVTALVQSGKVPAPDADTLYVIHFPAKISVSDAIGGTSETLCVNGGSSGFHDSVQIAGKNVAYAVIPDFSTGSCQNYPLQGAAFDVTTVISSHELIESVTDPYYEVAEAWSDDTSQQCGEIGDICFPQKGMAAGYAVQFEWSNKNNKCIDHDSSVVVNDFALALDPQTANAPIGGTVNVNVSATVATGSQPTAVALTADTLPMGVTASFAPASVQSNASSVLTLTVAPTVMPGSYPYSVTGTTANGIIQHSVSGMLIVQTGSPDMGMGGSGEIGGNGGSGGNEGSGGNGVGPGKTGCSIAAGASGGAGAGLIFLVLLAGLTRRRWT